MKRAEHIAIAKAIGEDSYELINYISFDMRDACKRNTTLPQIEDLHGIDITGGEMPEDYVRKMRGG